MFRWFLRLLGINEDRPSASKSSLLTATEAQQQAKQKTQKPEASPKGESKPIASKKTTKSPPQKKQKQSLADVYPDLKSNIIKVLNSAGFDSKKAIDKASDKDLLALKGVGKATIKVLRK